MSRDAILAIVFILCAYFWGYAVGNHLPGKTINREIARQEYTNDLVFLSDQYRQLQEACGIEGYPKAKKQSLEAHIQQIKQKYAIN